LLVTEDLNHNVHCTYTRQYGRLWLVYVRNFIHHLDVLKKWTRSIPVGWKSWID